MQPREMVEVQEAKGSPLGARTNKAEKKLFSNIFNVQYIC
jgi:hypothetical protein